VNLYDYHNQPKSLIGYEIIGQMRENALREILPLIPKYELMVTPEEIKKHLREFTAHANQARNEEELAYWVRDTAIGYVNGNLSIEIQDAYYDDGGLDEMVAAMLDYINLGL